MLSARLLHLVRAAATGGRDVSPPTSPTSVLLRGSDGAVDVAVDVVRAEATDDTVRSKHD